MTVSASTLPSLSMEAETAVRLLSATGAVVGAGAGLSADHSTYRTDGKAILDGVSLRVTAGEFIAIVGPNGAGKTTLLRLLGGLIQPDDGSIVLDGKKLSKWSKADRARHIAYVPQNTWIEFAFTVSDIVGMGRYPHTTEDARNPAHAAEVIRAAMAAADVTALRDRRVTELSAGERQRTVIARALAQQPRFLLLDEPMSALDVRHQFELLAVLHALSRAGVAVVCIMHDLALAARYFTRFIALAGGRVVTDGKREAALAPSTMREIFGVSLEDAGGVPVVKAIGQ